MIKQALAAVALTATFMMSAPIAPALANGAASTRNIIIGGAAATLLIINHNRKVHQKYAEYDHRAAVQSQENADAWAAYHQEQAAYQQELAENQALRKEVAYQHDMIVSQRSQLASLNVGDRFIAAGPSAPVEKTHAVRTRQNANRHVAMTRLSQTDAPFSMGWGEL